MVISQSTFVTPNGKRRLQASVVVGEPDVTLTLGDADADDGVGESMVLPLAALIEFCRLLPGVEDGALIDENGEGTDYALSGADSVWVRVDEVALWIRRTSWGDLVVSAHPNGDEDDDEIDSMAVPL